MVSNIFGLTIHNNLTIDGKLGTTLIIQDSIVVAIIKKKENTIPTKS